MTAVLDRYRHRLPVVLDPRLARRPVRYVAEMEHVRRAVAVRCRYGHLHEFAGSEHFARCQQGPYDWEKEEG